jgi:ectoine hydroxylase-related dioxygenase (phytanoyl-CoA dioxygenase family)
VGLSALDRYRFDLNGFLVLPDVLDRSQIRELKDAITARPESAPGPTIQDQRFGFSGEFLGWHQGFRDLIDHRVVIGVLDDLIGPFARLDHAYGVKMAPGTAGLGLHGPPWPFDAAQFYVHRGGRMWNGLLVFAWALTAATPGHGGFGCIPGSHRASEPAPREAEALVVEVPQPAGSLLVFTEALLHCTIPWEAEENRLSVFYKYSPGNSSWSPHPAVPPEVLPLLTEGQRRLVEPPYVGGRRPSF